MSYTSNDDGVSLGARVGGMSDRRRDRIRLDISREAARLFWEQGVAATTGEQIAEAVGLSVRTLWRHFRNKESCAEPIVGKNVDSFMATLHRWPQGASLEDHLAAELTERVGGPDPRRSADDLISVQMVGLADTEPAIRSTWLMACDRIEREMALVVGARLHAAADAPHVRLHAAASAAVIRAINEDVSRELLAGHYDRVDAQHLAQRMSRAVRTSTGGALGGPMATS